MREIEMLVGAVIGEIVEEYAARGEEWLSITEIAKTRGLSTEDLKEAIEELLFDEDFAAEAHLRPCMITDEDRAICPTIAGLQRHTIRWAAGR